jgi:hypothetical protein
VPEAETRVQRILREESITQTELGQIVARSAMHTLSEGFNRMYHHWLLYVVKGEVRDMQRTDITEVGVERGCGFQYSDHEDCEGQGCKECGWRGELKQFL